MVRSVVIMLGAVALIGIAWLSFAKAADDKSSRTPDREALKFAPADDVAAQDWFWEIIERSRANGKGEEAQLAALRSELESMDEKSIERFGAIFSSNMAKSYTWDLWGAAYVIMGGASDDGFEYFRVWMISRGRTFFEAAQSQPDELATLIPDEFDDVPEFETLAYVASEVWAAKTGKAPNEMPTQPPMVYSKEPSGTPWKENEQELKARYPKLWKRFSAAPLG